MKTMYIQCQMGAAGDMLMAALLDVVEDKAGFIKRMNALGLPGVKLECRPRVKCGITGLGVDVTVHGEEEHSHDVHSHEHEHEHGHEEHSHEHSHEHEQEHEHSHEHGHSHEHEEHSHEHGEHSHSGLGEIEHIIGHLQVPQRVKQDALAVYKLIALAESHAHGQPVEQVHFHEVGALDAVADIVGVCLLMDMIGAQRVVVSPVHVGAGMVRCAHGLLPVPAPATAHILQGAPTYGGAVQGELCTPTGAALLVHFAHGFGDQPVMRVEQTGYGMGKKDFAAANCVRVFVGQAGAAQGGPNAEIVSLSCNIDDMTGEALAYARQRLVQAGAVEVFTLPIQMKKERPGQMLVCLCAQDRADDLAECMLRHTTTWGVRRVTCPRYEMAREMSHVHSAYGDIGVKRGQGYGVEKYKLEYEDLCRAAQEHNLPLETVAQAARAAMDGRGEHNH